MSRMVKLKLPDSTVKEYANGITGLHVAESIGKRLAQDAVAVKINEQIKDVLTPLTENCDFSVITLKDPEGLDCLRHSLAHLLAAAVIELYPTAKRTIGPAIENGFYFDFEFENPISEEDLPKIEQKMKETLPNWDRFERHELSADDAKKEYLGNEFKHELIDEFSKEGKKISFYKSGDYWDLCKGGHLSSMKVIKPDSFKLTRLAGAYWRGNEKNKMLTRIYAVAFPTKKELDTYLKQQEEAEKRDHKKIGKQLDLYEIDDDIGPGLIIWLPKGNIIKEQLEAWGKETEEEWGYKRVTTPIITKEGLFHTSEHLPHYSDSMFSPMDIDGQKYYIKPMNCPFHHKVFAARKRSYRELPLRLAEYGWCHRFEQSGAITGLMRVRGMQMNDAHIYCTREQAVDEFIKVIRLHEYYYQKLGIVDYSMELALRDPTSDKYHGDEEMWKDAEDLMMEAMKKSGVKYTVAQDGAAFYGPKIDFQIKSVTGREFSASTNQIDLFMGKKFKLSYTAPDGSEQTPVIIHRAPLGTHERFIGFLIEHFAGKFPLWLNPVQVKLLPISDKHADYAWEVAKNMKQHGIRVEVDDRAESINKKVREAQLEQVNYMLVVGDKEFENNTVSVRTRNNEVLGAAPVASFIQEILREIREKQSNI